jgi:hypothetical protein
MFPHSLKWSGCDFKLAPRLKNSKAHIMKPTCFTLIFLLFLTGINYSPASAQDLRDRIGNKTGSISSDGRVRDRIGNTIGRIDSNGTIRDRIGNSIGRIDSNGTIRDRIGNSIGRVDDNGVVRDRIGNSIGRIDDDGTVRDRIGNSIGSARGVPKAWAAAVFFFDFF